MSELVIHPSLNKKLVPVGKVKHYPGNPRRGDVPLIVESMRANGMYRPIFVQKSTGYIVAGNHTYDAACELGAKKVPVVYLDVDDQQARKILLIDNRAADAGNFDDSLLVDVLQSLLGMEGLEGTGYSEADLEVLLDKLDTPPDLGNLGDDAFTYLITFDDEGQLDRWYDFVKGLRDTYPDLDTAAERVMAHVAAHKGA